MQPRSQIYKIVIFVQNNTHMKRFLALMIAALCALLLTASCDRFSLPGRMEALADTVEKNGANYTQEQWEQSNEKFQKLVEEYQNNKGSLTTDEAKRFRNASGRYFAAAVKSGVANISSSIEEIGKQIPGVIDEIGDFFKGLGAGLGQEEKPAE